MADDHTSQQRLANLARVKQSISYFMRTSPLSIREIRDWGSKVEMKEAAKARAIRSKGRSEPDEDARKTRSMLSSKR